MSKLIILISVLFLQSSSKIYAEGFSEDLKSLEGWNVSNNPQKFFKDINSVFEDISAEENLSPDSMPWSDAYWARYKGSVAYRWQTDTRPTRRQLLNERKVRRMSKNEIAKLSPAEKRDLLESNYDFDFTRKILRSNPSNTPAWQGLCHGWAEAAINHRQPKPVTVVNEEGVKIPFGVSDINALLSYYYAKERFWGKTRFLGKRCYHKRGKEYNCNGMNPGAFHLVLVESIKRNKSFVVDLDSGPEVWNHPVVGYTYHSIRQRGPSRDSDIQTVREVEIELDLKYVIEVESSWGQKPTKISNQIYRYWLELNEKNEIIGGSWSLPYKIDFAWYRNKGRLPRQLKNLLR